jgi:hypothetical protein
MKSKNNANYMEADDLDSVTVGSIQSKFADEYGAYNFSVEFTSATNTGFDDKSVDKSRTTRAKVMLGLIGLADLVYKGEKSKGRQAELGYQIRDAIEMFNNRSVVKEKLTPEEKEYLDGLHKTIKEIVVDPNSESEEE